MLSGEKYSVDLVDASIAIIRIKEDVEINVSDIECMKEHVLDATGNKPYASLIVSGRNSSITQEAMKLTASDEYCSTRTAMAIVVNTLPHRIMANFYIKFIKPKTNTRLFKTEESALRWTRNKLASQPSLDQA